MCALRKLLPSAFHGLFIYKKGDNNPSLAQSFGGHLKKSRVADAIGWLPNIHFLLPTCSQKLNFSWMAGDPPGW